MRSKALEQLADLIQKDHQSAEKVFRDRARKTRKFEDRAFCYDCGSTILNTPVYMVHHRVWNKEARMGPLKGKGFLHIGCLQERLGRPLVADDFTGAPCNLLVVWALHE